MSSGSATSVHLRRELPALARQRRARAAPACRRSPGGRTRPRRGARRTARPASAERDQPPAAREALRHPVAQPRDPRRPRARRSARRPRALASSASSGSVGVMPRRRRAGQPASQSRNASTPSPVRALTSMRSHAGMHGVEVASKRSTSKSRCGSRSILLISTSSQARNISGYLSGLSSPSVTDADHDARVLADAELGRADEVADVLDHEQVELVERQRRQRRADHVRVQVALAAEAGAGVELRHRDVQRASRSASSEPCTSPSSTPARTPREVVQRRARAARVLPAPGALIRLTTRDAVRGRSRRGWRGRSCCWRRARPRRRWTFVRCIYIDRIFR